MELASYLLPYYLFAISNIGFKVAAGLRELSFMALIQYNKENPIFACIGTLINENYVLTAAHCLYSNLKRIPFSVRLGEYDLETEIDCREDQNREDCNDPVQDIPVESVIRFPGFNIRKSVNDVGLIRLAQFANTKTNNVKPICLPKSAELINTVLTQALLGGWDKRYGSHLQKTTLDVNVERSKCEKRYSEYYVTVTDKHICAIGKNNTDSCHKEAGGPLFQKFKVAGINKYVQFGIVSAGLPCEMYKDVGGSLYTNVPKYMTWILDNIRP